SIESSPFLSFVLRIPIYLLRWTIVDVPSLAAAQVNSSSSLRISSDFSFDCFPSHPYSRATRRRWISRIHWCWFSHKREFPSDLIFDTDTQSFLSLWG
ncbi:hypothetical protein SAY86_001262, partial [Trapa natans]